MLRMQQALVLASQRQKTTGTLGRFYGTKMSSTDDEWFAGVVGCLGWVGSRGRQAVGP